MKFLSNEKIKTLQKLVTWQIKVYDGLFKGVEATSGIKKEDIATIRILVDDYNHHKEIQQDLEDILNAKPHVE